MIAINLRLAIWLTDDFPKIALELFADKLNLSALKFFDASTVTAEDCPEAPCSILKHPSA